MWWKNIKIKKEKEKKDDNVIENIRLKDNDKRKENIEVNINMIKQKYNEKHNNILINETNDSDIISNYYIINTNNDVIQL